MRKVLRKQSFVPQMNLLGLERHRIPRRCSGQKCALVTRVALNGSSRIEHICGRSVTVADKPHPVTTSDEPQFKRTNPIIRL